MDNHVMETNLACKPLEKENWQDFEKLFGANGACGGCWCMFWRLRNKDFQPNTGEGTRKIMQKLVADGIIPGLLGYVDDEPVAWVSVAPRTEYIRLENSKILARVDDQPVWSIVCFFVNRHHRRKGLMLQLIQSAVKYAQEHDANIVEAYPIETTQKLSGWSSYVGLAQVFKEAGFIEVVRRSQHRPIMRYRFVNQAV
jgi:GNAT superfamily N-acetyltransferase